MTGNFYTDSKSNSQKDLSDNSFSENYRDSLQKFAVKFIF